MAFGTNIINIINIINKMVGRAPYKPIYAMVVVVVGKVLLV